MRGGGAFSASIACRLNKSGGTMPETKPKPSLASRLARPLLAGAAATVAVAAPHSALADIFLELDGIKGESNDQQFKDQIDVLSYTQSFRNTGTVVGGGGAAGKVSCGAVTVLKNIDRSSPSLIQKVATGQIIRDGTLTFRTAGAKELIYYQIRMTELLVSAVDQTDNPDAGKIVEKISLNAAKYNFKYTEQKSDGSAGGSVEFGFDCKTNQKF
jgi:type VI secretion system secreted protein Hcp